MTSREIVNPPNLRGREAKVAVNLYGHLSTSIGLGATARHTAEVLIARGDTFAGINVVPVSRPAQQTMDVRLNVLAPGARPPGRVNLFHMNPPEIGDLLKSPYAALVPYSRLKLAVPFWELSRIPPSWAAVLDEMDAVLAPSLFLKELVEQALPHKRVLYFPQGVSVPSGIERDRNRWGMARGTTVFLCAFDLRGDISRKNPVGVVQAFRQAFPGGENVELLIRANHLDDPDFTADAAEVRATLGDRVRLVEGVLAYEDVLSLYASADALVSLHRSEGLGLGMLEAMTLGTPVIATAYAGNMDFMDESSALLVDFSMVPVMTRHPSYAPEVIGEGQRWAEPDLSSAASAMRAFYEDEGLRRRIAAAGRHHAAEVNARHMTGAVFDEVYALDAATSLAPERWWKGQRMAWDRRVVRAREAGVAVMRSMRIKPPAPPDEKPALYPVVTGPEGLTTPGAAGVAASTGSSWRARRS